VLNRACWEAFNELQKPGDTKWNHHKHKKKNAHNVAHQYSLRLEKRLFIGRMIIK
jgi:hypothetical protein